MDKVTFQWLLPDKFLMNSTVHTHPNQKSDSKYSLKLLCKLEIIIWENSHGDKESMILLL